MPYRKIEDAGETEGHDQRWKLMDAGDGIITAEDTEGHCYRFRDVEPNGPDDVQGHGYRKLEDAGDASGHRFLWSLGEGDDGTVIAANQAGASFTLRPADDGDTEGHRWRTTN